MGGVGVEVLITTGVGVGVEFSVAQGVGVGVGVVKKGTTLTPKLLFSIIFLYILFFHFYL